MNHLSLLDLIFWVRIHQKSIEKTRGRSMFLKQFWEKCCKKYQWEFQDPKMELLYHIRPYVVGIFPEIKAFN